MKFILYILVLGLIFKSTEKINLAFWEKSSSFFEDSLIEAKATSTPKIQISPTKRRAGTWRGFLLATHQVTPYSLFFDFRIDKKTDSIRGSLTIERDEFPYFGGESYHTKMTLSLYGKSFNDSLYFWADTSYIDESDIGLRTMVRNYRLFTKSIGETNDGRLYRFMQGIFIDSAQFKDQPVNTRLGRPPQYGVFLVEQRL